MTKKTCTTADRENLENEMLMTKLGGTVGYCEVKLDGQHRRLVVVAGHPMEFRSFCQMTAIMLSGCMVYQHEVEADILNLWDELGYQELNQVKPLCYKTSEWADWEFAPTTRKNFYSLMELLKNSQGEEATTANFHPMLAEIGRRAAEAAITRG